MNIGRKVSASALSLLMVLQMFPYNIAYAEEKTSVKTVEKTSETTKDDVLDELNNAINNNSGNTEDVTQTCLTHLKGYNNWLNNIKNTDIIITDPINYESCNTPPIIELNLVTSIDDVKFSLQQNSKKVTFSKLQSLVKGIRDYEDSTNEYIPNTKVRIAGWGQDKNLNAAEQSYCKKMKDDFNKPCLTESLLAELQKNDGLGNIVDGNIKEGTILDYTILYKYTDTGTGKEGGGTPLTSYAKSTIEFNSPPKLIVQAWKTYRGYNLIITDAVTTASDLEDYESNGVTTTNYKKRVTISGLDINSVKRQTVTYKLTDNYGDTTTVQQIVDVMPLPYLTDKGGKRDDIISGYSTVTWNKKNGSYYGQGIGVYGVLDCSTCGAIDLTNNPKTRFNGGVSTGTLGTYNTGYTFTSPWNQTVNLPFKVIVDKDPTVTQFDSGVRYYEKGTVSQATIINDIYNSMTLDKAYGKTCTSNANPNVKGNYYVTCVAYNTYDYRNTSIKSNTENRIQAMFKNFSVARTNSQIKIWERISASATGNAYYTGKKKTFVTPNVSDCAALVNTNGTVTSCSVQGNVKNEKGGWHNNALKINITYYAGNSNWNQNQYSSILVPIHTTNNAPTASFKTLIVRNKGINWSDMEWHGKKMPRSFTYVKSGQSIYDSYSSAPKVGDYFKSSYDKNGDAVKYSFYGYNATNLHNESIVGTGSWGIAFSITDNDAEPIIYSKNTNSDSVTGQYIYMFNARPTGMRIVGNTYNGLTNSTGKTAAVKKNNTEAWGYTVNGGGLCGNVYCYDNTVSSSDDYSFTLSTNGLPVNVKFEQYDNSNGNWWKDGGRGYEAPVPDFHNDTYWPSFVAGFMDGLGYRAPNKTIYTWLYYSSSISSDSHRSGTYAACAHGWCK